MQSQIKFEKFTFKSIVNIFDHNFSLNIKKKVEDRCNVIIKPKIDMMDYESNSSNHAITHFSFEERHK